MIVQLKVLLDMEVEEFLMIVGTVGVQRKVLTETDETRTY